MSDFLNNINLIRKNWIPSKKWEDELRLNEEKDRICIKKFPVTKEERKQAKQYGKTVINVIDKLDQQSINKSTDAMIAINTIFSVPTLLAPFLGGAGGYLATQFNKMLKSQKKISIFNGAMIGSSLYFIIIQFINSQLEKETTRIARFQSRNDKLKDLSSFIIHTETQNDNNEYYSLQAIDDDNYSDSKLNVIKSYKNAFRTIKKMKEDYKEYKDWKKDFKVKEQISKEVIQKKEFKKEELANAQKDRNKIINIIYKLELAANNEEINFQYATDLIMFVAKLSGTILATLLCLTIPKNANRINSQSNIIKNSKLIIPLTIPTLSLFLSTVLAKFQKDSAKLGRYEKKKELSSNEEYFITFENAKKEQVKIDSESKENESFIKNIINDIKSIKTMPKRLSKMYSEYNVQQAKDLSKHVQFSNKQREDAKLLQKQLFYSYEKIDEKSEGFTDDMDVILNTTKIGIGTAVNVGFNIYSLNLLTNKLKTFNGQKIPEFLEGLKLMKNLGRKDMVSIFIIPYAIKSIICVVLDTITAYCRKKANRIGVMTAIKELQNEKYYTKEYLNNII